MLAAYFNSQLWLLLYPITIREGPLPYTTQQHSNFHVSQLQQAYTCYSIRLYCSQFALDGKQGKIQLVMSSTLSKDKTGTLCFWGNILTTLRSPVACHISSVHAFLLVFLFFLLSKFLIFWSWEHEHPLDFYFLAISFSQSPCVPHSQFSATLCHNAHALKLMKLNILNPGPDSTFMLQFPS